MQYKKGLTEEAKILDQYLKKYSIFYKRKKVLEMRRDEILSDFQNPLKARNFGEWRGKNNRENGCSVLPVKLDEVNTRIEESIEDLKKQYQKIGDILEFLPEESVERLILEYRYIDKMSWGEICRTENMAKTPIIQLWRKGLLKLLEFQKIKAIVESYKKTMH